MTRRTREADDSDLLKRRPSRALLVTYTFPPLGGPGVQRALKFCKYLPVYGWQVSVLTVKRVLYHAYDPTLLSEIPSDTRVVRSGSADPLRLTYLATRSWQLLRRLGPTSKRKTAESSNLTNPRINRDSRLLSVYRRFKTAIFVVDPQILWLPFALVVGVRTALRQQVAVIVGMPQPNSVALLSYLIARVTRRPLVLDLRDPWMQDPYFNPPTRAHRTVNAILERFVYEAAAKIVVISRSMQAGLVRRFPQLASKITVITNGYDRDDVLAVRPFPDDRKFDITYVGSLYAHHAPAFATLLDALDLLAKRRTDLAQSIRLRLVGRVEDQVFNTLRNHNLWDSIDITNYLPHREALKYTLSADLLVLIIKPDLDPEKQIVTIPGKLFEYLASRSPVLYIGPDCEARDILVATGQGYPVPTSAEAISKTVEHLITEGPATKIRDDIISSFERKQITDTFSTVLREALNRAGPPGSAG